MAVAVSMNGVDDDVGASGALPKNFIHAGAARPSLSRRANISGVPFFPHTPSFG